MTDPTSVKPGDWIYIKYVPISKLALVFLKVEEEVRPTVKAIFRGNVNEVLADEFHWIGGHWEFTHQGPTSTLAEAVPAAQPFISIFEAGYHPRPNLTNDQGD